MVKGAPHNFFPLSTYHFCEVHAVVQEIEIKRLEHLQTNKLECMLTDES